MKALKAERTNEMPAKLICLNNWLSGIGVTSTTGWRWRKKGILPTVNIYGRLYVTAETAANFVSRATAGECKRRLKSAAGSCV